MSKKKLVPFYEAGSGEGLLFFLRTIASILTGIVLSITTVELLVSFVVWEWSIPDARLRWYIFNFILFLINFISIKNDK